MSIQPADLIVGNFDFRSLNNDKYQVTVTLSNGTYLQSLLGPGQTYPGGGTFEIDRMTGGTDLNDPGSLFVTKVDPGSVIAQMPIPMIPYGQSITLTGVMTGRAIISAGAFAPLSGPDAPMQTLPEINPDNDIKTVDYLTHKSITLNSKAVSKLLGSSLLGMHMKFNGNFSSMNIPGFSTRSYSEPDIVLNRLYSNGTSTYTANNIGSTSTTAAYQNGALILTVHFANSNYALNSGTGHISVKNLAVTVKLPLAYNAVMQFVEHNKPTVQVSGVWTAHVSSKLLTPDVAEINSQIQLQVSKMFNEPTLSEQLDFWFN
jgi:hypothetical protein